MLTVLLMSRRSKGLGDLETAGVESGDSSEMSQYSSLMSGVDCSLVGQEFSSPVSPILFRVFLKHILHLHLDLDLELDNIYTWSLSLSLTTSYIYTSLICKRSPTLLCTDTDTAKKDGIPENTFEKINPPTISQLIINIFRT